MKKKKKVNLKEKVLPKKINITLKVIFILVGIILFLIYGIKLGGFASLLFELKQATSVLKYIVIIFVVGILISIGCAGNYNIKKTTESKYNGSTYDILETTEYIPKTNKQKQQDQLTVEQNNGCIGNTVLVVIGIFLLLALLGF